MASLNLLFVHEVNYEKKPIFEMHEFPEHLAAKGHQVTFLQFDEGFKFWRDQRQPAVKTIKGRVLTDVEVDIVTPFQFGIPGLDRLWATISVWPILERLLTKQKFDAIVLYAVPTYGRQVLQLAKKHRVPVVFRALDVSHLIRQSALSSLIKSAEKYVYEHADFVSANNPAMAEYCASLGGRLSKTSVNLPPLDVSHFKKSEQDLELGAALGLGEEDSVIAYMGSFFYFSGLDTVIREFAEVGSKNTNLKLLLIGGGEQDAQLRKIVAEEEFQDQIIFTGFIPYSILPAYLQQADVVINPMLSSAVSNTAFPHKVLQYMAAGIPVVSTKLDGIFETFGAESGISWASGPAEVLHRAIELTYDPALASELVARQSATVERLLGIDRAVDGFEALIRSSRLES